MADNTEKTQEKAVKSESQEAVDNYLKVFKKGIESKDQAKKMLAVLDIKMPEVSEDQEPIKWVYMTYDANVFFDKKFAFKHAMKLSGGNASIPTGKVYPLDAPAN